MLKITAIPFLLLQKKAAQYFETSSISSIACKESRQVPYSTVPNYFSLFHEPSSHGTILSLSSLQNNLTTKQGFKNRVPDPAF
jgi:hypothetical protein